MGNEEFLIVSYFLVGLFCACLGLAAYLWLRGPAERIFGALQREHWENVLKKSFPASVLLFALSGFMSVSYYGCENRKYNNIVSDRSYVISVNERQISETLSSIVLAVLPWTVIMLVSLLAIRREQMRPKASNGNDSDSAARPH
jgi:hypothetical protein